VEDGSQFEQAKKDGLQNGCEPIQNPQYVDDKPEKTTEIHMINMKSILTVQSSNAQKHTENKERKESNKNHENEMRNSREYMNK